MLLFTGLTACSTGEIDDQQTTIPSTVMVTFYMQGQKQAVSCAYGEKVSVPSTRIDGYDFVGWFSDVDHTIPFDTADGYSVATLTADTDVFGLWTSTTHNPDDDTTNSDNGDTSDDADISDNTDNNVSDGDTDDDNDATQDPAPSEPTIDTITLYFTDTANWGQVYAYVWQAPDSEYIAWPGQKCAYASTNVYSQKV